MLLLYDRHRKYDANNITFEVFKSHKENHSQIMTCWFQRQKIPLKAKPSVLISEHFFSNFFSSDKIWNHRFFLEKIMKDKIPTDLWDSRIWDHH